MSAIALPIYTAALITIKPNILPASDPTVIKMITSLALLSVLAMFEQQPETL